MSNNRTGNPSSLESTIRNGQKGGKKNKDAATSASLHEDSSSPAKKKLKVSTLPEETLNSIAEFVGQDIHSVLEMARSDPKFAAVIGEWKCTACNDALFLVTTTTTKNTTQLDLSIPDKARPFLCGVCGTKHCGNKYGCNPYPPCPWCGKIECRPCMLNHSEDCAACGFHFDGYCSDCQGPCEDRCKLCNYTFCQHHGDRCDECGIQTCGIHDFRCDRCSYCTKTYCNGCHDHGDAMWTCGICRKASCNADGSGSSPNCPRFVSWDRDWPLCPDCNEAGIEQEEKDDDDEYYSAESEETNDSEGSDDNSYKEDGDDSNDSNDDNSNDEDGDNNGEEDQDGNQVQEAE